MGTAFLDHPRPLAFAHRGGAAHAPENSWRAFEHAVQLGYGYLETDIRATADGVLVAFHGRTLTRLTDRRGRVSQLPYRKVADALIDGTEPIPVLEDLLAAWPDARFNLDVKEISAIAPLARVLRRTNAWNRVCVVSFSGARLRATRSALGRPVCMAASPFGTVVVGFCGPRRRRDLPTARQARPGHQQMVRPAGPGAWSSWRVGKWGAAPFNPLTEWLARSGARCVQVPAAMATPVFILRAHALGLHVHAWTVNNRRTMERLLDRGVDGLMTDETVVLRDVLSARNQWHPM